MIKKRRTYNPRLVKANISHSVQDIAELFGLHKNAVLRWIRDDGLPLVDKGKPYLVYGQNLIDFLTARQNSRRKKCQPDEFYCLPCRAPRHPVIGSITHRHLTSTKIQIQAICATCGRNLKRISNIMQLANFQKIYAQPKQRSEHLMDGDQPCSNSHISIGSQNETI